MTAPAADILIVDDTPVSLRVLGELLTGAGYRVRPAATGELALRSAEAQAPMLVLLDVVLPGLDGFEVCRRLKAAEATRAVPVIFISAHNTEHEKVQGFQAGGVDYITKPYQPEEVLARVHTHLTLRRLHLELQALNQTLDQQVQARTAALADANAALTAENAARQQLEAQLRLSEMRYRRIVETAEEGVWLIDREAVTQFVNEKMAAMLGYSVEAMRGRHLFEFMDEAGRRDAAEKLERRRQGVNEQHEFRFQREDGSALWTLVNTNALLDEAGQYLGALAMVTDFTERKRAADAVQASELKYHLIADTTTDWVDWVNPAGQFIFVSPSCQEVTGYPAEAFLADPAFIERLIHPEDRPLFAEHRHKLELPAGRQQLEFRIVRADGAVRWMEHICRPVYDAAGQFLGRRASNRDITERVQLAARLQVQATTDGLTGVANRRHFIELAQAELKRARRLRHPLALALVDLDHFKRINDTYGHAVGDAALQTFARVGQQHLREIDVLGRFGGDEFVVLLPETNLAQAGEILERLRRAVAAQPIQPLDPAAPFHLSLSAGVVALQEPAESLDVLLGRADQALYQAKAAGRNCVQIGAAGLSSEAL